MITFSFEWYTKCCRKDKPHGGYLIQHKAIRLVSGGERDWHMEFMDVIPTRIVSERHTPLLRHTSAARSRAERAPRLTAFQVVHLARWTPWRDETGHGSCGHHLSAGPGK